MYIFEEISLSATTLLTTFSIVERGEEKGRRKTHRDLPGEKSPHLDLMNGFTRHFSFYTKSQLFLTPFLTLKTEIKAFQIINVHTDTKREEAEARYGLKNVVLFFFLSYGEIILLTGP